ncbi:WecB/TagA/CpsF family glycosyltransferase [Aquabacterium fontiphilum]|uniref:WecB/TagA/CpsF family glycosyltransferase n=1 Tax=Aquabacterium fontiphilum TaxID=450365 RepID=UPI001F270192|nr:WecB/TagA/CpsF family glycosyltransferase [Aquabacterium fontiphilum]
MRHPDPNFGYPSLSIADHERIKARVQQPSPSSPFMRRGAFVLDSHIDAISWEDVLSRIVAWADQRQSRYVTLCNVHSVVTAAQDDHFNKVIGQADLALPDGAPVAWALRREGHANQQRINGPDLMWRYLAVAERLGHSVFFYGSSDETLDKLRARITAAFPKLRIAGMLSPPFRPLSREEDQLDIAQINASGANVVFVGLGCPKQESWMHAHRGSIRGVMIGVGAAFDYHAGIIHRAPAWMQKIGMEWFHRLCSEPRRLAKRYFVTNTVFIARVVKAMFFGQPERKGRTNG